MLWFFLGKTFGLIISSHVKEHTCKNLRDGQNEIEGAKKKKKTSCNFSGGMESFSWFLSMCLSLKPSCSYHRADNHTYSMHRSNINLRPCFIPQSFINHTESRMKHCLLEIYHISTWDVYQDNVRQQQRVKYSTTALLKLKPLLLPFRPPSALGVWVLCLQGFL